MRKIVFYLSVVTLSMATISVTAKAGSDKDIRAQVAKTAIPSISVHLGTSPDFKLAIADYSALTESFELDHGMMAVNCVPYIPYRSMLHKAEYQVPDRYGNS